MELQNLSPAPNSKPKSFRRGRGIGSGLGKQVAQDTKDKTLVQAEELDLDSKADNFHSFVAFQSEVLTITTLTKFMQQLMLVTLTSLTRTQLSPLNFCIKQELLAKCNHMA